MESGEEGSVESRRGGDNGGEEDDDGGGAGGVPSRGKFEAQKHGDTRLSGMRQTGAQRKLQIDDIASCPKNFNTTTQCQYSRSSFIYRPSPSLLPSSYPPSTPHLRQDLRIPEPSSAPLPHIFNQLATSPHPIPYSLPPFLNGLPPSPPTRTFPPPRCVLPTSPNPYPNLRPPIHLLPCRLRSNPLHCHRRRPTFFPGPCLFLEINTRRYHSRLDVRRGVDCCRWCRVRFLLPFSSGPPPSTRGTVGSPSFTSVGILPLLVGQWSSELTSLIQQGNCTNHNNCPLKASPRLHRHPPLPPLYRRFALGT